MEMFNTLKTIFKDKRRLPTVIMILLFLLTILALLGFIVYQFVKPQQTVKSVDSEPIIVDQPMLLAPYTPFPDDYYINRPPKSQWTEEEKERWFTEPEGELLENLHDTNDSVINHILEIAP